MADKIMLLDGHSLMNRAFYGLPALSNSAGQFTNAVLGFLNIMLRYVEEEEPSHLLVAFDRKEPTFRHLKYKEYKGTRKPMPQELREQIPRMKEVLEAMEIPVVTQAGIEADDILGTIGHDAEKAGYDVVIVSGDRDLLQLATRKVMIKIPKTKGGKTVTENYYEDDFRNLYGITPEEFVDMKGLMGDSSDNIPGVPGIGEKTAAKIIGEYHSIENAYEHIDQIKPVKARNNLKEYYSQALLSKDLAAIRTDCQLDYAFADARLGNIFNPRAYELFKQLELNSLLKYFDREDLDNESPEIRLIRDHAAADRIKEEVVSSGRAGLAVIRDHRAKDLIPEFYGLSLTFSGGTFLFLSGDGLTEKDLREFLTGLLEKGVHLDLLDYKACLHFEEGMYRYEDRIDDVGIGAYLLNPLQSDYDYDVIARDYLDLTLPSRKELLEKISLAQAVREEKEGGLKAAGWLSSVPYQASGIIRDKLKKESMEKLYLEIEKPLVYSLYSMEKYGITVKREALKEYGSQLEGQIRQLEESIYAQAGHEFNLNSPKQLGVVLFEEMKMPFAKKTKTGYSTNAEILEKLAPDYPVVKDILNYRQLAKLKSTYADGLAAFIREDGKIHGIFHQKVTATGRLSSSDPNLQNIPIRMPQGRAIRKVFVPGEGMIFVSAD